MEFSVDNLIGSISAIIAVIALLQSKKALDVSNKQHLFDRRLSLYLTLQTLLQTYEDNRNTLKDRQNGNLLFEAKLLLFLLANNSYLESVQRVTGENREDSQHKKFLIKLSDMRSIGKTLQIVFRKQGGNTLAEFVFAYAELLSDFYKCIVCTESCKENNESMPPRYRKSLEDAQKEGKKYEEEVTNTIARLEQIYQKIVSEKMLSKTEKVLKL
ncbi:MAG TPA: hypothetical protein DDY31_13265 [Lachnospiraceae bacterium]|nr:hypothetical protein [Lachnospiraceae bacterium]